MEEENLTHIQSIDIMLGFLKENHAISKFEYPAFFEKGRKTFENVMPYLQKLADDGYIYDNGKGEWVISFDGLLFDGYVSEQERQALLQESQQATITFQRENAIALGLYARRLNSMTGWIAVATLIAGVYYAIQIFDFFYHFSKK